MKRLIVLCGLPVAAALGLWLWSGGEIYTKTGKAVIEQHRNLFGDIQEIVVMRPGPFGGYYLGLDLVAIISAAALLVIGGAWVIRRVRRRPQGATNHDA